MSGPTLEGFYFLRREYRDPAGQVRGQAPVHYESQIDAAIQRLHDEGRYRTFIDIERRKGAYPQAIWRRPDGTENDDHRLVLQRLPRAWASTRWCWTPCTRRSTRPAPAPAARATSRAPRSTTGAGGRTGRPARQGSGAALHLGLRRQRGDAVDAARRSSRACIIYSDALNHASMIEGIRARRRARSASSATTTWRTCEHCWPRTIRPRRS